MKTLEELKKLDTYRLHREIDDLTNAFHRDLTIIVKELCDRGQVPGYMRAAAKMVLDDTTPQPEQNRERLL